MEKADFVKRSCLLYVVPSILRVIFLMTLLMYLCIILQKYVERHIYFVNRKAIENMQCSIVNIRVAIKVLSCHVKQVHIDIRSNLQYQTCANAKPCMSNMEPLSSSTTVSNFEIYIFDT